MEEHVEEEKTHSELDEVRVVVRFPPESRDLVDFLDEQVLAKQRRGLKSNRSDQIRICIRARQISMLHPAARAELIEKMNRGRKKENG